MLMADCTERLHLQLFPMQLSRVGRILEHALHKKFLTLGEVLSVHTNFQTLLITPAIEWSHSTDLGVSAPPPNADLAVNLYDLFSFHISTSLAVVLVEGTCSGGVRISIQWSKIRSQ